ncbi:Crp/Fnr family transcriptional regulator [Devosia sp. XJ19-1]|uniref:Crp/Fnr family transcriptional regulator n=1 Tax=Devosia ureilytica TaxID=2952754 RepID=A0A9Q4APB6_9HYPH|nr:Crp/Fnr family transcriptional regulator [Devosia ureilytica]MCP8883732.1 Crp/Fnr family transcriptional regulator [Devosia ureilytica]MCP8887340.1 Crp/Fnr family transcriptional regulator [Devosia ureilytica]
MSQPRVSSREVLTRLHVALGRQTKARLRRFSQGETVYEPGMEDIVGYVVSGAVKQVVLFPDGRSNIIGLIEAPGFFGRAFGVAMEFTIEAASDVVLACFDRSSFETQLSTDPILEHLILMENLHQLDEAHERILVLACQSVIERICTFMLLKLLDGAPSSVVHVPINRRDFAAYLGTTVESVSRSIQALVRRGTIAVIDSANFEVLQRDDLIAISRQDEDSLLEMMRSRGPKYPGRAEDLPPVASRPHDVAIAVE